jgi:hypothetical protein
LAEIEKEVVYVQVDKSTTSTTKKDGDRDKTLANDCDNYDHTNHFSSPDVPLVTDNNYDTCDDYDHTNHFSSPDVPLVTDNNYDTCDDYDHTNHFSSPDVPLVTDNNYDTCDDYDHTNHFYSPDVPLVTDNTYDTMQSIEKGEENNYNCAHEAEKHPHVILDNDEYSVIEITK